MVHLPRFNLEFKRIGKLDVENYSDIITPPLYQICATVQKMKVYLHAERYVELRNLTTSSSVVNIHYVKGQYIFFQDGNIFGMPQLTAEDIIRAYDIYGLPVPYVGEKMNKKGFAHAVIDFMVIMREKVQVLHQM